MGWSYKVLKMGRDGRAEWLTAELKFKLPIDAARAAMAYMVSHADRGEMVVVSLEPSPELKPVTDRLREHQVMLDYLKAVYRRNSSMELGDLIREIDPYWIEPNGQNPA
jgi:hypothetical protein